MPGNYKTELLHILQEGRERGRERDESKVDIKKDLKLPQYY